MIVENNLTITKKIKRTYEPKFARDGNKIGDHLNLRLPVRWEGRTGEKMAPEGAQERKILLTIDQLIGQDLSFSNVDLTLKIDDFKARYLDTACATIANRIDEYMCLQYVKVPNMALSGVPGVTPNALDCYFDASVTMSNYGVPPGNRSAILSPRMEVSLVNALKGLFQAAGAIASQYQTGMLGHVIGFDFDHNQNIYPHVVGPLGGVPLVDGAGQTGASILLKGWTAAAASRLKKGDIITFASVDGLNPQSRQDIGELRQFTVTADLASTAGGAMNVLIDPAIEVAGPYRNITGSPADSAVVKIFGHASAYAGLTTHQGLCFHKEWLTAAFVDLDLPQKMQMSARAKLRTGLSIRIVKGYDIDSNREKTRLDCLFGSQQQYGDFAVRVPAA